MVTAQGGRINRYIMECKCGLIRTIRDNGTSRINRYIMECKYGCTLLTRR